MNIIKRDGKTFVEVEIPTQNKYCDGVCNGIEFRCQFLSTIPQYESQFFNQFCGLLGEELDEHTAGSVKYKDCPSLKENIE